MDSNVVQAAAICGHAISNVVQTASIRGTPEWYKISSKNKMHKDDFFTLVTKDRGKMFGIRFNNSNSVNNWEFGTHEEANNFLSYLESNTARFFLSLVKVDVDVNHGQLNYIPTVDFTRSWTDIELYEHFGFSDELIEYLEEFLGDYYNRKGI